eukprot:g4415.t1
MLQCFVVFSLLFTSTYARSLHFFGYPWYYPSAPDIPRNKTELPEAELDPVPVPEAPESESWFSSDNKQHHSAVLIAGSRGYYNYRHQADVCHAYRILRERGFDDDHIITFVYDDIAFDSWNPYPGQIFNAPGGRDVYPGCAKDYTGEDVNKENLMAVMTGDEEVVKGVGSGRVLKKDPNQKIFMFYSDHGSVGVVGMPTGGPWYAHEFSSTLKKMINDNFFKEFVFYLESCESGSMFQGMGFNNSSNVLLVSASGPSESSYATYCPVWGSTNVSPSASDVGACLGDLFSVSWMEYAESHNIASDLISDQINYVTNRTSDSGTFDYGSHVFTYADPTGAMRKEVIGNFLSFYNIPSGIRIKEVSETPVTESVKEEEDKSSVHGLQPDTMKQQDADLKFLMDRIMSNDFGKKDEALRELEKTIAERRKADASIRSIVKLLMDSEVLSKEHTIDIYVDTSLPRGENQAAVDDWDCLVGFAEIWEKSCGEMTDYSRQYTRTFANLCNQKVAFEQFRNAVKITCEAPKPVYVT